jgi:small subunit ribosomal protein S6
MESNKYELGVVVRADLDEETLQAEMDRVRGLLDRFGAVIEKEDKWGRRKLAYPIDKHVEGVYTFITYTAPGQTPREVESRLRLMENVLRFLTINMNEVEAKKKKASKNEPEEAAVEQVVEPTEAVEEDATAAANEITEPIEVEAEAETDNETETETTIAADESADAN